MSKPLTRLPNGSYQWACSIDRSYYRRIFWYTGISCGIIAAFVLAFGAFLAILYDDWQSMLIVGGCVAVFAVITVVVCFIFDLDKDPQECYEMTEDYIKTGAGKSAAYYGFERVRVLVITRNYLELRGKISKLRVYTHEEDRELIRSFIKTHVPEDADIRYQ